MPGPPLVSPRPRAVHSQTVEMLASALGAAAHGSPDALVSGVSMASSSVRPGDLFVAAPGAHRHGVEFAAAALGAGAAAVLTDADGLALLSSSDPEPACDSDPDSPAPARAAVLVVDDPRQAAGQAAAAVYGHPSQVLDVVGITGTSGKTTTSFLVHAALAAGGRRAGLIGTVGVVVDVELRASTLTTPEAPDLQALLAVMVEAGADSAVMEVSSHALALKRVAGVEFAVAAFTNLSQDHLDFHADIEDYFEAKARLFDGRARRHFVVVDDEWGRTLAARLAGNVVTVSTVAGGEDTVAGGEQHADDDSAGAAGVRAADWSVSGLTVAADGSTSFTAVGPAGAVSMSCRIPGAYNVANAVLALAIATELGLPADVAADAIGRAQVPGRMERIDVGQPFLAVVDYSHKPAAVEGALRALRPLTTGRLIIVLGCGGDRDRGKRPLMGAVAARAADVLIVTDDNPRSEHAADIRAEMLAGARSAGGSAEILEVGPRAEAIAAAVSLAGPGDTVLVAGKGHETGQDVSGVIHPFDDRLVLRSVIETARVRSVSAQAAS